MKYTAQVCSTREGRFQHSPSRLAPVACAIAGITSATLMGDRGDWGVAGPDKLRSFGRNASPTSKRKEGY